jgi:hypothetical protein
MIILVNFLNNLILLLLNGNYHHKITFNEKLIIEQNKIYVNSGSLVNLVGILTIFDY